MARATNGTRVLWQRDGVPDDNSPVDVVWFKRDLRVEDHAALHAAAQAPAAGGTVYLYVYEPDLLAHASVHPGHVRLVGDALGDLASELTQRGGTLWVRSGRMPDVLTSIAREVGPIRRLLSHQETGHAASFARDRRVQAWCRTHRVSWTEFQQDAVERGLKQRDGWSGRWRAFMTREPWPTPSHLPASPAGEPGVPQSPEALGLHAPGLDRILHGGNRAAHERLASFLTERGRTYTKAMAFPHAGAQACSRLSADLAVGALSARTAYQTAGVRLRELEGVDGVWARSVRSFRRRLAWRSHFMQKLESEWTLETQAMNRELDGVHPHGTDHPHFAAWRNGRTGFPIVDAGMRALEATGWVNFRLRATIVSVATHTLGLDWRPVGEVLARRFLDFEPGIHWSQVQMQASVTGINTIRIYNPHKQALDVDPDATFVRTWVPELADAPGRDALRPDLAPPLSRALMGDYPNPVVDQKAAYRTARDRLYRLKGHPAVKAASQQVLARHVDPHDKRPDGQRG